MTSSAADRGGLVTRADFALRRFVGVLRDAFVLGAVLCAFTAAAQAQKHANKTKAAPDIIAQGRVVNGAKAPVANAVVYLENPNSMAIKSYLTDEKGQFHFNELSPQTDYEVWAEQNGVESKHKFISQFSSHTHFDFRLQLSPKKKKLLGIL